MVNSTATLTEYRRVDGSWLAATGHATTGSQINNNNNNKTNARGVWLAKKWLRFGFQFGFGFTKLTAVSFFGLVRPTFVCRRRCHLSFTPLRYNARNDVLPCWIGPTNCPSKWLRTRSAEIRHEEKYFDCWSYHAARWTVNQTKQSPNHRSWFLKTEPWKTGFHFF